MVVVKCEVMMVMKAMTDTRTPPPQVVAMVVVKCEVLVVIKVVAVVIC
jgi:hypothetical protein